MSPCFGDTAQVAGAINRALCEHPDVELVEVSKARPVITEPLDLLVVGGSTQAFSMTWPTTARMSSGRAPATARRPFGSANGSGVGAKGLHSDSWRCSTPGGQGSPSAGFGFQGAAKLAHMTCYTAGSSSRASKSRTSRAACWRVSWVVPGFGVNGWGLRAGDRPVERLGDQGRVDLVTGPCGGQHQRCPRPHRGPT
jgi:hypothetical protein